MEVTRKDLAQLFNLPDKRITTLVQTAGLPNNGKPGKSSRYPLKECIEWYVNYRLTTAPVQDPTHLDVDYKGEYEYWRAQKMKHVALQISGKMVTVEDADREISHRLSQVRDVLLAVEHKWSPFLVGLDTLGDVQGVLRERVDEMMTTLSSLPDIEEELVDDSRNDESSDDEDDDLDDE